jgi:Bacterial RNA polymerase, alpha chain C terminal domain
MQNPSRGAAVAPYAIAFSQSKRTDFDSRALAVPFRLRNTRPAKPGGLKAKGKQAVLDPTPELPDDTLIEDVRFATRIRNVLNAAGLKTVGEVRETSDEILLSFQDLGQGSVAHLRETLGLPSCDGVRPG